MKHLLSFSKLFENDYISPTRAITQTAKLIALNKVSHGWSSDDMASDSHYTRTARVYLDDKDTLWMEIRETGGTTGPYERPERANQNQELWFGKIGTLSKPDLNKVKSLMKPDTGNAHHPSYTGGYGFINIGFGPKKWRTPENEDERELLSEILNNYKLGISKSITATKYPDKPVVKNRDEMIEEIGIKVQQMSDEQLQQLLSRMSLGGSPVSVNRPKQPSVEGKTPEIVNYGEKAFAVFGNTIDIKDQLSHLGGKYNRFLTNPKTQQREPGWIFPNGKKIAVEDILK